jgi:hypothetical protein
MPESASVVEICRILRCHDRGIITPFECADHVMALFDGANAWEVLTLCHPNVLGELRERVQRAPRSEEEWNRKVYHFLGATAYFGSEGEIAQQEQAKQERPRRESGKQSKACAATSLTRRFSGCL